MILVRDVFQLKFGKAKEAKELWKDAPSMPANGGGPPRAMFDVTGQYYTFVLESTFPNLGYFEESTKKAMGAPEFSLWYQKFASLVESGHREIFTVID